MADLDKYRVVQGQLLDNQTATIQNEIRTAASKINNGSGAASGSDVNPITGIVIIVIGALVYKIIEGRGALWEAFIAMLNAKGVVLSAPTASFLDFMTDPIGSILEPLGELLAWLIDAVFTGAGAAIEGIFHYFFS